MKSTCEKRSDDPPRRGGGETMGMNVYTLRGKHIGKRSAAGVWCWDCRIQAQRDRAGCFWFCPTCGRRTEEKTMAYNPAFRELGFDKREPQRHHGVDGASRFCWQVGASGLGADIPAIRRKLQILKCVKTEYGEVWKMVQFDAIFRDVIEENVQAREFS